MRTKVRYASCNGANVPMFWDNAAAMDFGEAMGLTTVNEIQAKMGEVIAQMQPDEEGNVQIRGIKTLSLMVHTAIVTGCDHEGQKCSITARDVTNALMTEEGVKLIETLVECLMQFAPVPKEESEDVGKQMAAH